MRFFAFSLMVWVCAAACNQNGQDRLSKDGADASPEAAVNASSGSGSPGVVVPASGAPKAPEFSRIYYVGPGGSDRNAGTQDKPFATLAFGMSALKPGEALFVLGGQYRQPLRVGSGLADGAAGKPKTVRAAPGVVATILPDGSGDPLIGVQRAYWNFENLVLDAAGTSVFGVLWSSAGAHHGALRNSEVKNSAAGACVNVAEKAADIVIENNRIHHCSASSTKDSHGVILQTTSKNVTIRGNDIHHNSGDSVQCIGPEGGATIAGTPFDNALIEGNQLHDNRENGVDVKTCTRVVIRRNEIYGHKKSTSSGGEGIVIHLSAKNVVVEDNAIHHNGRGVSVGGIRVNAPPTQVVVRRNRIWNSINTSGEDGVGIRIDTSTDVQVYNNTLYSLPGPGLLIGHGDTGNSDRVDVRNNIISDAAAAIKLGPSRSSLAMDRNLYSASGAVVFSHQGVLVSLANWRSLTGQDKTSKEGAPAFVDALSANFQLRQESPGIDQGLNLGLPFCGGGPDQGALEAGC